MESKLRRRERQEVEAPIQLRHSCIVNSGFPGEKNSLYTNLKHKAHTYGKVAELVMAPGYVDLDQRQHRRLTLQQLRN